MTDDAKLNTQQLKKGESLPPMGGQLDAEVGSADDLKLYVQQALRCGNAHGKFAEYVLPGGLVMRKMAEVDACIEVSDPIDASATPLEPDLAYLTECVSTQKTASASPANPSQVSRAYSGIATYPNSAASPFLREADASWVGSENRFMTESELMSYLRNEDVPIEPGLPTRTALAKAAALGGRHANPFVAADFSNKNQDVIPAEVARQMWQDYENKWGKYANARFESTPNDTDSVLDRLWREAEERGGSLEDMKAAAAMAAGAQIGRNIVASTPSIKDMTAKQAEEVRRFGENDPPAADWDSPHDIAEDVKQAADRELEQLTAHDWEMLAAEAADATNFGKQAAMPIPATAMRPQGQPIPVYPQQSGQMQQPVTPYPQQSGQMQQPVTPYPQQSGQIVQQPSAGVTQPSPLPIQLGQGPPATGLDAGNNQNVTNAGATPMAGTPGHAATNVIDQRGGLDPSGRTVDGNNAAGIAKGVKIGEESVNRNQISGETMGDLLGRAVDNILKEGE